MTKKKDIKQDIERENGGRYEDRWIPTISGSYIAYIPEYLDGGNWKTITFEKLKVPYNMGIPYSSEFGGITQTIHLYDYEQAKAIAWLYASLCASQLGRKMPKIRMQPLEVVFEIKARKTKKKEKI